MLVTKLVWCLKNLLNGYETTRPLCHGGWCSQPIHPILAHFFLFFFLIYLLSRHWEISNKKFKVSWRLIWIMMLSDWKSCHLQPANHQLFLSQRVIWLSTIYASRSWFLIRRLAMGCIFLAAFMSTCHSCASSLFVRATVSSVDVWCYIIGLRFFVRFPELPYALLKKTRAMDSLARCRPI